MRDENIDVLFDEFFKEEDPLPCLSDYDDLVHDDIFDIFKEKEETDRRVGFGLSLSCDETPHHSSRRIIFITK